MDLIDSRTTSIAKLALDGLYERSKAISTNTANALTPGYQRKEVNFESSLRNVIEKENEKEQMKLDNSAIISKNLAMGKSQKVLPQTPEQVAFLASQVEDGFSIDVQADPSEPFGEDGNNVNLEVEMMDEAKNGMQYQVVAGLLSREFSKLSSVIQGQSTNS